MPTTPPLLCVRHVTKDFPDGVRALDGVDLEIGSGEWVAITGPSGAGKSTLLQLVAALERPTAGQILFRGRDLADTDLDDYRRRHIGIVFQLHNLLPHLSVRENLEVAMYGTHRGRSERQARIDDLVRQVDLVGQQWRQPPQLSGGERQRAAIARALVNDPELLLADEPTGSLDPAQVFRLVGLVERLIAERHLAVLMVTHDATVAERADRQLRLRQGRTAPGTTVTVPEPA